MADPTRGDIIWNYLAVLIAGVSGVLLFLLVGELYGPSALGVFNTVMAVYIVLSQVASFGVQLSVLKYLTEASSEKAGDSGSVPESRDSESPAGSAGPVGPVRLLTNPRSRANAQKSRVQGAAAPWRMQGGALPARVASTIFAFAGSLAGPVGPAFSPSARARQSGVLLGGLLALLPSALGVPLLLCLAADPLGRFLDSPDTGRGLYFAAAGLAFFALNKTLLAAENALMRLRAYAAGNSLRYVFMLAALVGHWLLGAPARALPVIFPVGEGLLSLVLILDLLPVILVRPLPGRVKAWAEKHFFFGLRAFGGHLMLDLNTRVDILCLAPFVDKTTLGIYSMAAILAEAAYQLPVVLRVAFNPKVILLLFERDEERLRLFIRKIRLLAWAGMGTAAIVGTLLYPWVLPLLMRSHPEYALGAGYFGVIMAGAAVAAGYVPFGLMLANGGYPGRQSQMILLLLLQNFAGNLLLIPLFGAMGAAVSTGLAHVSSLLLLRYFVRRHLGMSI